MKKMILSAMVAIAAASSLAGCASDGSIDSTDVGTGLGAVVGAVAGSQFGEGSGKTVAAVVGSLAGAWAGSKIAQGLNTQDRGYYDAAANRAATAPVGQQIVWNNPQTGTIGTIVPVREGRTQDGYACREYQQTVTIGGKKTSAYGTACKQPDGSWKIMDSAN